MVAELRESGPLQHPRGRVLWIGRDPRRGHDVAAAAGLQKVEAGREHDGAEAHPPGCGRDDNRLQLRQPGARSQAGLDAGDGAGGPAARCDDFPAQDAGRRRAEGDWPAPVAGPDEDSPAAQP